MAAAIEAITGLVLIVAPHVLIRLLFGVDVTGAAIAIGRVAGIALLSLGASCWRGRHEDGISSVLTAMLVYNLLVTIYLISLGIGGETGRHTVVACDCAPRFVDGLAWLRL